MARTKSTARRNVTYKKSPEVCRHRSTLLQLMGLPKEGVASAKTASANWPAVIEYLSIHPKEASIKEGHLLKTIPFDEDIDETNDWATFEKYPLAIALANEQTPLNKETLRAFIAANEDIVLSPRSLIWIAVSKNRILCKSIPDIINIFQEANPHFCGLQRTRTFELMGFSPKIDGPIPLFVNNRGGGHTVNWKALEKHLRENPEEAKIVCPVGGDMLFPLEVALRFSYSTPPLSVIELLLKFCPEAVTINGSSALMWACSLHSLEDPEVIRAILRINPKLASVRGNNLPNCFIEEQFGLPLHTAVYFLPCAAEVVPDLMKAYPPAISDTSSIYDQIPLQVAIRDRRRTPTKLVKVLLEYGHLHRVNEECESSQLFFTEHEEDCTAMNELISNAALYREDYDPRRAEETFQNACLGFQAAGASKTRLGVETMWDHPLLHGAIEFARYQWILLKILEQRTPQADLIKLDAFGRTPLVVAIEMAGSNNRHDPDEIDFSIIIEKLLDDNQHGCSKAARLPMMNVKSDVSMMLPLHQALYQGVGLEDGSKYIVNAYPESLSIPDPKSKLFPCLLAAVGERAKIETIFGLIIMRPDIIVSLISSG